VVYERHWQAGNCNSNVPIMPHTRLIHSVYAYVCMYIRTMCIYVCMYIYIYIYACAVDVHALHLPSKGLKLLPFRPQASGFRDGLILLTLLERSIYIMYVCIFIYIATAFACTYFVCVCVGMHIYIYIYICIYMYVYTYIHIHTYIHTL
jgi:hypothetical protein